MTATEQRLIDKFKPKVNKYKKMTASSRAIFKLKKLESYVENSYPKREKTHIQYSRLYRQKKEFLKLYEKTI